ncbi:uncharacterized protein LOC123892265 [Trifolium pratense]|nr:uncharacterized protein LOC123892265 [Trifolium pratense]
MALEAMGSQEDMAVEANVKDKLALKASDENNGESQRLDCIYDDEPLGFEKDPHSSIQRMQAQDPLQEVDIGDGSIKRPTYISANIDPILRERMVELLKSYKDCFAWDYNEMPGLSRNLVEHRLPLRPDKKPVKQLPRRFAPEIMTKIKAEIERLLKCKFIRTARYVEWLANIVPVIKKNGSLRVCIDFRDLNNATPKDEYSMPVAEMLVDSAAGHELKKDDVLEWGTEQQKAFDEIKPLRAVKGQIVADFLADHSVAEVSITYVESEPWMLYFDGSRHKHSTGIRILIISPLRIPTKFKYKINGTCSNNEAEYEALIAGLKILLDLGAKHVKIRGDSELIIKQLTKEYKCIQERLMKYFIIAFSLLKRFDSCDIQHVPRIENQEANDLAQIASGYKLTKEKLEELVEIKEKLITCEAMPHQLGANEQSVETNYEMVDTHFDEVMTEIFVIDNLTDSDWRQPIVNYLENPAGITERKVKYRALSYTIMGNELFKKTPEGVLLKCLSENEAYVAISNAHSGACGAHQAGHKMKWLLFRQRLYWPSMLKDCIEYAKGCQECQKHAGTQHVPASELHSIVKPWPFRGWALYLIGEIRPASSKNQRYILVGIDYFTKWIEAIALTNVDQEAVINFVQNHIIYRFGLPETITTDQGTVFVGRKMQDFAEQSGFKLITSTPYYAQANGQVEAANKVIIGLIKRHVAQKPKNWLKTLDQVLWACRNSPKESTDSTPFRLTYGHDAVLPVEIMMQSIRVQRQLELPPYHYWNLMLDGLIDVDEERLQALDALIRQKERIAKAYNKKVKSKTFDLGDLVWKVILPMDRRDRVFGKWSPNWEGPFKISQVLSNGAYEIEELTPEKRSDSTLQPIIQEFSRKYKKWLNVEG